MSSHVHLALLAGEALLERQLKPLHILVARCLNRAQGTSRGRHGSDDLVRSLLADPRDPALSSGVLPQLRASARRLTGLPLEANSPL